ncbi:MAG TPA: cyclic nucleotide-binding protein [Chloroflexi bacterium]|nr:cyclic nucleotide-binding protein [Chloroflexota bacterium]
MAYLSENDLFQDFSRQEMLQMERRTTMRTCEPGRIFYQAGETAETLYILKEGTVHLYRLTPDGRKLIVATLEKGAVFGELALVGQRMHSTFAEAATNARICIMGRTEVKQLLLAKPQMALRLLKIVGERLHQTERQLEQMAFNSISRRLARKLLELSYGRHTVEGYSHQELADMIGTYRETVTATLNDFKAQRMIAVGRKHIDILDRDRLEMLVSEL